MKLCLSSICLCLAATMTGGQAYALDCKKASTALEHKICADKGLMNADATMSSAYSKLLRAATDPDIHTALINSQRRWIAARENNLGNLGVGGDAPDSAAGRKILLDATIARTDTLTAQAGDKRKFIADALKQRANVAAYSGGAFAGYNGSCSFIPHPQTHDSYTYSCFGALSVQNGGRVCTDSRDFASYTMDEKRAVANIVNGKPEVIATCAIGSSRDSECPDMYGASKEAHWNLKPAPEQSSIGNDSAPLIKLDPELAPLDTDQDWFKPCLSEKSFPAANPGANRVEGE